MNLSKINTRGLLFLSFFIFSTLLWPVHIKLMTWNIRLNEIFYIFTAIILLASDQKLTNETKKTFLFIGSALLMHLIFTSFLFCNDYQQHIKSFSSILIFLIMIFSGMELGIRSTAKDWINLEKTSLLIITLAILFLLIEIAFPEQFPKQSVYRIGGLYSGIYDEPSHLAFSIFPPILLTIHSKNKSIFIFGIIASIILLFLSASSTLILILIISVISFSYTRLSISFFFITAMLFIFSLTMYSTIYESNSFMQFQIKIQQILNGGARNLSSLIYLQGWYDAIHNLTRTWGIGLGFNMMGCEPFPVHSIRSIVNDMNFYGLNSQDGSFLFSKGLSEMGIFFLIFITAIIFFCIRVVINSKNMLKTNRVYLSKCLMLITFLVSSIFRSSGFFCGTFALLILAIASLWKSKKNAKKSN